ncbi:MAG: hypothetical protein QM523_10490 [Candidatus Pacebacteria bacterium]|nr:hypothetical protein [Candidatus Paceibacterota bacterium]
MTDHSPRRTGFALGFAQTHLRLRLKNPARLRLAFEERGKYICPLRGLAATPSLLMRVARAAMRLAVTIA